MSLATIRESPGLDAYLDGLEERLAAAVEACPGLVATVGAEALAAGGKDNGAPGIRASYGENYYAAFVIDPDGHNVEAVCLRPE